MRQWLTITAALLYMVGALLTFLGIWRLAAILTLAAIGLVTLAIYLRERVQRTP